MSNAELHKSIEAKKLNARSGLPLKEPPVTIPFAAILERIERDRDLARFYYLGQRYICRYQDLKEASGGLEEPEAAREETVAPTPDSPAAELSITGEPPAGPALWWEPVHSPQLPVRRAKVPGGWLLATGAGLCFYPDPDHKWSGASE
jgi:hypothetical protein